jgi:hypothetical protein
MSFGEEQDLISFFHSSKETHIGDGTLVFQSWDSLRPMNQFRYEWLEPILEQLKKGKDRVYESDIWCYLGKTISRLSAIDPIFPPMETQTDQERWKRELFHDYSKKRMETKEKDKYSLKKIQTWLLKGTFESLKERDQYMQWASTYWNVPLIILDYDRLSLQHSIQSFEQLPKMFVTNIRELSDWTEHMPIILAFHSQGRFFSLSEWSILPSEISYICWKSLLHK